MNDNIMVKQASYTSNTVHDFESLIDLLRNRLNWPIPENRSNFDDLTFYWSPENLELDPKTEKRIKGCWQVRILNLKFFNSKQPWGIFIVQFENNVRIDKASTLLKRVLRGLVDRRGRSASLPFWRYDRLLFICLTEDFQNFGFVRFMGKKNDLIVDDYTELNNFKLKQ